MTLIPLVISAVSLILSITVAWLTLFRRGTLGMTQPMLVGFLHEGEQAKILLSRHALCHREARSHRRSPLSQGEARQQDGHV
jgi:hypothetical protein